MNTEMTITRTAVFDVIASNVSVIANTGADKAALVTRDSINGTFTIQESDLLTQDGYNNIVEYYTAEDTEINSIGTIQKITLNTRTRITFK